MTLIIRECPEELKIEISPRDRAKRITGFLLIWGMVFAFFNEMVAEGLRQLYLLITGDLRMGGVSTPEYTQTYPGPTSYFYLIAGGILFLATLYFLGNAVASQFIIINTQGISLGRKWFGFWPLKSRENFSTREIENLRKKLLQPDQTNPTFSLAFDSHQEVVVLIKGLTEDEAQNLVLKIEKFLPNKSTS